MPDLPHVLAVDDDARLRSLLRRYLAEHGFLVTTAEDAAQARALLQLFRFDVLVLDVMMPGESGLNLARDLHASNNVPILMLTARSEADDRIAGLEAGVDDYLPKPFEPRELVLRLAAILRRTPVHAQAATIQLGRFRFDLQRAELDSEDGPVKLTEAEASLLRVLAQAPGAIVSREELAERSGASVNARSVDVQVTRLRRKIEEDPKLPRYLQTVRGAGYVLRPD